MLKIIGKWLVGAFFAAFVITEVWFAFDSSANTWPLTQEIVTYVPPWLTIPAAVLLAVWIVPHFVAYYRKRKATLPAPLLAASEVGVPRLARYNKFWVAALTAALEAAQTALPLTPREHGWCAVVLAVLGAGTVLAVPNKPAPVPAPPTTPVPPDTPTPAGPAP